MGMIRMAALGALGYAGYKYFGSGKAPRGGAAFASGQCADENFAKVRDAGPEAMADRPSRKWTREDQSSDESFPASDPPANY